METKEKIFSGMKLRGIKMLIINFLFLIALIVLFVFGAKEIEKIPVCGISCVVLSIILLIINTLFWAGFMQIEPNEARVLVFFGKYKGTVKEDGFFWVNPFYAKKRLTLRARNLDVEPIKVNDKKGNPIMIGQVLVWRVVDTYKASFEIDNTSNVSAGTTKLDNLQDKMKAYEHFVKVQSDAALRHVAGMYAYDNMENEDEKLTLRSAGEEINEILEQQLNERLSIAGIAIMEARVNYLAYAPEIAAVMLRRQQADAIIAAREKIVDGAVGMVKMALEKLLDEKIVNLDEERKAAMVTNLMVVLCSDQPAQPIINSGTLYN
ncbi:MAG: SPFH domain-containing protein [Tannerella sp.]|jgi:regulator of protease activity HflC (stomatin/prohibitin superfamily)|nr:SPFH domain-containing protein [Tannerella sp.]